MDVTWQIYSIRSHPQLDGRTNVVSSVKWGAHAVDGSYTDAVSGIVDLPVSNITSFVPYDQLTESQVVEWVKNALGEQKIKQLHVQLSVSIESRKQPNLIKPKAQTSQLPWVLQQEG